MCSALRAAMLPAPRRPWSRARARVELLQSVQAFPGGAFQGFQGYGCTINTNMNFASAPQTMSFAPGPGAPLLQTWGKIWAVGGKTFSPKFRQHSLLERTQKETMRTNEPHCGAEVRHIAYH